MDSTETTVRFWQEAYDDQDMEALRFVVSRLGLADVRTFGLTWEDCETFLGRLGFRTRVEVFG